MMRKDSFLDRTRSEAAHPSLIARMPGGLATLLACLIALLSMAALVALFYPYGEHFPRDSLSTWDQVVASKALRAMREPALGAPGHMPRGVSELRVLHSASVFGPAAVRYTFDHDGATRRAVRACSGDIAPGQIVEDRTTRVSPEEAVAVLAALDASGYWSMPANEHFDLNDGRTVLVETIRDGVHRVRVRVSPEYKSAARGLAGFAYFDWDIMHRAQVDTPRNGRCPS